MKNSFKVALAAVALVGLGSAARADLTFDGAVGLPLNPTAQVPQERGARIQGNYLDFDGGELLGLVGAIRVGNSPFEVSGGVQYLNSDPDSETGFSVGAKYLFSRETDPANVRLAAGLGYSDIADSSNLHGYVVASKYLTQAIDGRVPIIGHLGLRYDTYDVDGAADSDSKVSVYGGVEVPLTRKGDFQFVGELQSKNREGGEMPYSAALRYRASNQPFGASIGVARTGGTEDSNLFAQIGYTFDTK